MARVSTHVRRRLGRWQRRSEAERQERRSVRSPQLFRFDAAFRLGGIGNEHDAISVHTGLIPSHAHLAGEAVGRLQSRIRQEDIWILRSPLGERASLNDHLAWLWAQIGPHKDYFRKLVKDAVWADVCLGCLSESPYPMLAIDAESLALVKELNLDLSFNFTCS